MANFIATSRGDVGHVDYRVFDAMTVELLAAYALHHVLGFCDGSFSPACHIAYFRAVQSCWSRHA